MRIIFIVDTSFNERDKKRLGINKLKKRNFKVLIWDFTPFLNPKYYQNCTSDLKNSKDYVLVYNKEKAKSLLLNLNEKDHVIPFFFINKDNLFLFDFFIKKSIKYSFLLLSIIPKYETFLNLYQKIKKHLFQIHIVLADKIKNKLFQGSKKYPAFSIIVGGEKAVEIAKKSPYYDMKTKILDTHVFDYEFFIENNNFEDVKINDENYVVMLDEYGPYHPDYLTSLETEVNDKTYYRDLTKFFDLIEKKYDTKVIIAAHPKSNYNKKANPFDGRKVLKGNTLQLIKKAKFVLAHVSTAISFAILYKKPILFLSSSDYSLKYKKSIKSTANILGRKVFEIDKCKDMSNNFLEVNLDLYDNYKELYIKTKSSPEKSIWNIFADYLQTI